MTIKMLLRKILPQIYAWILFITLCFSIISCLNPEIPDREIYITMSVTPEGAGEIFKDFENPVAVGDTLRLRAKSTGRYIFSHWFINDSIFIDKVIEIYVSGDIEILAIFKNGPVTYALVNDQIFDISDPNNILTYDTNFPYNEGVVTIGNRYVIVPTWDDDGEDVIYSYDFYNILNPEIIDSIYNAVHNYPYPPILEYPYLLLYDKSRIELIDISDPYNLVSTGPIGPILFEHNRLSMENRVVYISRGGAIKVLDIRVMDNPILYEHWFSWLHPGEHKGQQNAIQNNLFFVHGKNDSIYILDASDLSYFIEIAQLPSGNWYDFEVEGNYLYQGNRDTLQIFDISDPFNPKLASYLVTPQEYYHGTNYAYVPPRFHLFDHYLLIQMGRSYPLIDIEDQYNPILINMIEPRYYNLDFDVFEPRYLSNPN